MSEPIKDSVEYIANKFAENPGHFAATILKMYWDMEKQHDQYKQAYQHCVDDLIVLRANNKRLERENRFLLTRKDNLFDSWRDENKRSVALSKKLEQLERENAEQLALLKEFRKLIDYKLTLHQGSSMYREYRSKLDQLGVK